MFDAGTENEPLRAALISASAGSAETVGSFSSSLATPFVERRIMQKPEQLEPFFSLSWNHRGHVPSDHLSRRRSSTSAASRSRKSPVEQLSTHSWLLVFRKFYASRLPSMTRVPVLRLGVLESRVSWLKVYRRS